MPLQENYRCHTCLRLIPFECLYLRLAEMPAEGYLERPQHDSSVVKQLSPNCLLCKPAVIRLVLSPSAGILSPLALLLIKETVFLVLENRQASERQERAHKSRCPFVTCPEPGGYRARLRVPVSLWPGKRRDCVARSRGDP